MIGALFVYCLCFFSGVVLERRLAINNLLKRTLLVLAVAAAQLMFAIESLSLWKGLDQLNLFFATAAISAGFILLLGWRRTSSERVSWSSLLQKARSELRTEVKDTWTIAIVLTAVGLFTAAAVAGWLMLPFNDLYHFEMPRFWIQRHTVLPFPVNDPRVVTLSFLSEALQLPGYLYGHADRIAEVATIIEGLLAVWIIFSLARRAGGSFSASICAAAITVGYTSFALDVFHASAEMLLAGVFFGGSLLFLMDAYANQTKAPLPKLDLACSTFLFVMACGAKNSTMLISPLYLMFFAWVIKSGVDQLRIAQPSAVADHTPQEVAKRIPQPTLVGAFAKLAPSLIACGVAGLLCSGVAWNYVSNKVWFGKDGLPTVIRTTVSQDFHPRAVWTRISRGAVLLAYDTLWIPKSVRGKYALLCEKTVGALGGQYRLPEDDDSNFSFTGRALTPLKGLGLLGLACFLPGLALTLVRLLSARAKSSQAATNVAFNRAVLLSLALGAFLACHIIMRWQAIGLIRLMFFFVVAGAPLAALILEKQWLRAPALVLLLLSSAMFVTFWTGHVSRRMGWDDKPGFRTIARLQNNHSALIHYQWKEQPPAEFDQREDYSNREIYAKLLAGLRQPCSVGLIGNANDQCLELFGPNSQNRVVPLVDCRAEAKILEPPADLNYVVAANKFAEVGDWAKQHGYEQIFSCANDQRELLRAFEKIQMTTARAQETGPARVQAR